MEEFGGVWRNLEEFGRVWKSLEEFGRVWGSLEEFGRVWKSLEEFGEVPQIVPQWGPQMGYPTFSSDPLSSHKKLFPNKIVSICSILSEIQQNNHSDHPLNMGNECHYFNSKQSSRAGI